MEQVQGKQYVLMETAQTAIDPGSDWRQLGNKKRVSGADCKGDQPALEDLLGWAIHNQRASRRRAGFGSRFGYGPVSELQRRGEGHVAAPPQAPCTEHDVTFAVPLVGRAVGTP